MMESRAKRHNIFCLDKEKVIATINSKEGCGFNGSSNVDIIDFLIDNYKKIKNILYKLQKLKKEKKVIKIGANEDCREFELYFFFNEEHNYNKKLKKFCADFVEDGEDIFTAKSNIISSILFIASAKNIFVITTGQGFRIIDDFCIQKFGMKFLSEYIERIKISKTEANKIASAEHSSKIVYGQEVSFIDINTLDTIYKEITGKTNNSETIKNILSLDNNSKKKSLNITAKTSLQIGSSLTLEKLLKLLAQIDCTNISELVDFFNSILPLSNKTDKVQIELNNNKVLELLYFAKNSEQYPFVIFNREDNLFIEGEKYIFSLDKIMAEAESYVKEDIYEAIFNAYKKYLRKKPDSFPSFHEFATKLKLSTRKDDYELLEDTLLNHISGEIVVGKKNYFIFYGKYYLISDSYTTRLNMMLTDKLKNLDDTYKFTTTWTGNENEFNKTASENENYIHLHKVLVDNLEFADLVKLSTNSEQQYIVHVKEGFDGNMRILERQIELSMIRLNDLTRYNHEKFFEGVYKKSIESSIGKNLATIFRNESEFIQNLKNKKPIYVMAIKSETDFISSSSNIAKHCLMSLINKSFELGFELRIAKIGDANAAN